MIRFVYVAGPYTKGDVAVNVREAMRAADTLRISGFTPFLPHLTHFWHLVFPHAYTFWLEYDAEWLERCDAVLRIPGESHGADQEVARAHDLGIPVFDNIAALQAAQSAAGPQPGVSADGRVIDLMAAVVSKAAPQQVAVAEKEGSRGRNVVTGEQAPDATATRDCRTTMTPRPGTA